MKTSDLTYRKHSDTSFDVLTPDGVHIARIVEGPWFDGTIYEVKKVGPYGPEIFGSSFFHSWGGAVDKAITFIK